MSPHELQQKLLEYYTEHYAIAKEMDDVQEIKKYLGKNELTLGICHTATAVFDERIFRAEWTESYKTYHQAYWCCPPAFCDNKPDILSALSTRIQILTELVKQ